MAGAGTPNAANPDIQHLTTSTLKAIPEGFALQCADGGGGAEARPSQVRKLRSLRETLVSLHEMSDFTRRGVCVSAGRLPPSRSAGGLSTSLLHRSSLSAASVHGTHSVRVGGGRVPARPRLR
jgi:hypothetical protein